MSQHIIGALSAITVALLLLCIIYVPATAEDHGQWANQPPEIRAWYQDATLTPAAQKRFGFVPCCEYAEVVRTKFKVDSSSGAPQWWYLDETSQKYLRIPDDIIHWDEAAPDNKPTLFRLNIDVMNGAVPAGTLTCFYPPGGAV